MLILSNKSDIEGSLSADSIAEALEIVAYQNTTDRVKVFSSSLVEGTGYGEAFKWLSDSL